MTSDINDENKQERGSTRKTVALLVAGAGGALAVTWALSGVFAGPPSIASPDGETIPFERSYELTGRMPGADDAKELVLQEKRGSAWAKVAAVEEPESEEYTFKLEAPASAGTARFRTVARGVDGTVLKETDPLDVTFVSEAGLPPLVTAISSANPVTPGDRFRVSGKVTQVGRAEDKVVSLAMRQGPDSEWRHVRKLEGRADGTYAFDLDAPKKTGDREYQVVVENQRGELTKAKTTVRFDRMKQKRPAGVLYPDVQIKNLTECSQSERSDSDNGTCFSVRVDKYGVTGLWFPTVTGNVGDGPLRLEAYRPSKESTEWRSKQVLFYPDGSSAEIDMQNTFYWAGDGHDHWHITDFDLYEIFDESGELLERGEKHGFCFFDNTSWRDWVPENGAPGRPGVAGEAVYVEDDTCGEERQDAIEITHGLSKGWADTYPTRDLEDQYIDITGFGDGTYVVKVTADWQGFIAESSENNNVASARVTIENGEVTEVVHLTGG